MLACDVHGLECLFLPHVLWLLDESLLNVSLAFLPFGLFLEVETPLMSHSWCSLFFGPRMFHTIILLSLRTLIHHQSWLCQIACIFTKSGTTLPVQKPTYEVYCLYFPPPLLATTGSLLHSLFFFSAMALPWLESSYFYFTVLSFTSTSSTWLNSTTPT